MSEISNAASLPSDVATQGCPAPSQIRRRLLRGSVVAVAASFLDRASWARTRQQNMQQAPATAANSKRTFLHQETNFRATPQHIYSILLDSKQFAVVTGMPAEIDPNVGGAFTMFGGLIVGRNVELISDQRIVQAWRPTHWEPGVYSVVRFELKGQAPETVLVLDHTGFPEGEFDHLNTGWPLRYWDPLKKYIAAA
ncbi:MAG: SRPBCC domain-containing protein [Candidatus Acidiferrales bacterium]